MAAPMGVRITVQSQWTETNRSAFVYEFAQSRIVIGRSRSADVQLPHVAVSGTHATISTQGVGYAVVDEGSTNGTRVNEVPLVAGRARTLKSNDVVDLGGYRLSIEVCVPVANTMSANLIADFAKRLLSEQVDMVSDDALRRQLEVVQSAADQEVELLPISKEQPSIPPPQAKSRESRPSQSRSSRPTAAPGSMRSAKLERSELVVYALATLVVAASLVAMALLMQP